MEAVIHISNPSGHRSAYRDLLALELGCGTLTGPAKRYFLTLLRSPKVLFATLDGDIDRFLLIALLRCLLLRRTCGLFIGPLNYVGKPHTFRHELRALGFRLLKRLPLVSVLSVIPHSIRPELARITSGWIHDPQLWDLLSSQLISLPITNLSREITAQKGSRTVVLFLGKGSHRKGLPDLVRLVRGIEGEMLVVVAGRIMEECKSDAQELIDRGMIVEDRFISDEELLSLYGVADRVWCVYRPDYDQASGVFGRAVQLGVTPIIRAGTVLDDYASFMGVEAIRFCGRHDEDLEAFRLERGSSERAGCAVRGSMVREFRRDAVERIRRALGQK